MEKYILEVKEGDKHNREALAAKLYFRELFGTAFSRNNSDTINAALDYGYSIILSAFNREIKINGYLTQIGIKHNNMFNHFNLASDFMEPYRPIIDEKVFQMLPINEFSINEKYELIDMLNTQVSIDGRMQFLSNAISIYCRSIFKALQSKNIQELRFFK